MISIPNTPTLHHDGSILRDGFVSMMIIGKSGCGKTNFVASLIPHLSEDIKTLIVASVIQDVPAHQAIIRYFRKRGNMAGTAHTPADLRQALLLAKQDLVVTPTRQGLIIFDDFNIGSPRGEYWDATIDSFTKGRNSGWNFIIIAQYPTFIPPIIRNNTTCRILFDCYSSFANASFFKDIQNRICDREAYDILTRYIQAIPYTYLMVQDRPFTISAGKLDKVRPVLTEGSVTIPTLNEILREMGVRTRDELNKKTAYLQAKAGNTSKQLLRAFRNSEDTDDQFDP